MDIHKYASYVYLAFIVLIAVLAIFVVRPFFTTIAFAAVFAYWLLPLHRRLSKIIKNMPSALVISISLFVVLLAIAQYGIFMLVKEAANAAEVLGTTDVGAAFTTVFGDKLLTASTFSAIFDKLAVTFTTKATELLYSIPSMIVGFFAFILTFFYFLLDGPKIVSWLKNHIPFPRETRKKIISSTREYMNAFLKAHIIIGLLQGLACAFGFFLFGLHSYILIGSLVAALLSILPIIGPYLLYVPIGLIIAVQGNVAGGIGLIIYGLAVGSFFDYVVRTELTGRYASIHPLAVLIGVLGGIVVFGLIGVIIGPIILGLCITIIESLSGQGLSDKSA